MAYTNRCKFSFKPRTLKSFPKVIKTMNVTHFVYNVEIKQKVNNLHPPSRDSIREKENLIG